MSNRRDPDGPNGFNAWVKKHRQQGHQPYHAPTGENPERWECKCDPAAIRVEQIRKDFEHLDKQRQRQRREREEC